MSLAVRKRETLRVQRYATAPDEQLVALAGEAARGCSEMPISHLPGASGETCAGFVLDWMRPPLPDFRKAKIGAGLSDVDDNAALRAQTEEGARKRWGGIDSKQQAQIDHELSLIRDLGFEVIEAVDADQAVCLLETIPGVTVLFTDIQMPGSMDGLLLAAVVRHRWPPIALLVTSGKLRPASSDMPTGARFIGKPYSPFELEEQLHSLTGQC